MNERFVNIKVDREERPDVDAIYMQATVAMTGQGGWPMTVVLDHDAQPFYAGTYFPPEPRHGQPAFTQILQALSQAWSERRDDVQSTASSLREHLASEPSLASGAVLTAEVTAEAVRALATSFDGQNAGFGGAPKFPPSMLLEFLLRHSASGAETTGIALDMVRSTCDAMARGGLYDQLGGGFARYSVDAGWVVPHFEKMLYDNAQLLGVYVRWWRQTGDPLGERVAREPADFLLAELGTAEGGFASALDADTEGVEGRFYVWTPAELDAVLGAEDGPWAAGLLSVTAAGTFEHGASTLQLRRDPDDPERWGRVRDRLLEARGTRTRPARDDKVVAAWNGLAIAALAEAGTLLDEQRYVDAAVDAARLLVDVHVRGSHLLRVSRDGVAGPHAGVLEDYACVAGGFLALLQATGDPSWLVHAGTLLDRALSWRAEDGGFFDTGEDSETLVVRPRDPSDNASPSGQSALVHALLTYAAVTGSGRHRDAAEGALRHARTLAERAPRFAGWSLAAAEAALAGPLEVAVVGAADDPTRAELLRVARESSSPGLVVVAGPPDAQPAAGSGSGDGDGGGDDADAAAIPLLAGRGLVDGKAAAYVCRGMVCDRPVTTAAELRALLHR
jgi:uncharacterized protein YyaL (SSP411 family)